MLERIKKFIWNGLIDLAEVNVFAVAVAAASLLILGDASWTKFGYLVLGFNISIIVLILVGKYGLMPIVNFLEKYKK